jgi:hypothetical protein
VAEHLPSKQKAPNYSHYYGKTITIILKLKIKENSMQTFRFTSCTTSLWRGWRWERRKCFIFSMLIAWQIKQGILFRF